MANKVTTVNAVITKDPDLYYIEIDFVADDSDATFDSGVMTNNPDAGNMLSNPFLSHVDYIAGGTAPHSTADVQVNNDDSVNMLGTDGDNIGAASALLTVNRPFQGPLTVTIAPGTGVNSATATVRLWFRSAKSAT